MSKRTSRKATLTETPIELIDCPRCEGIGRVTGGHGFTQYARPNCNGHCKILSDADRKIKANILKLLKHN